MDQLHTSKHKDRSQLGLDQLRDEGSNSGSNKLHPLDHRDPEGPALLGGDGRHVGEAVGDDTGDSTADTGEEAGKAEPLHPCVLPVFPRPGPDCQTIDH